MKLQKFFCALLLLLALNTFVAAQDRDTGSIKGKVRVESGAGVSSVEVIARQGEREVARTTTNRKGDFLIARLTPGVYGLTLRKPGLAVGSIDDIEVRAGKTRELRDRLTLSVDTGSLAFVRGSVFTPSGLSARGVRVELSRVEADGALKKLDGRITDDTGSFVFRLTPEAARYRVSVKVNGADPLSKDVEVDGAAIYRVALTLPSAPK